MADSMKKTTEIKIEIDPEMAQGAYSNMAMIVHNESEFVVDFVFVQPGTGKNKVRARIIQSPGHAKRLLLALDENIKKYEERFGQIKIASKPKQSIMPTSSTEVKH